MLDDGYTRIANEILDRIISFELSKRQLKVVLAIIRKTYGFNKKEDDITMSQVVKMTTLDKSAVSRTMAELFDMNVLSKRQGNYGQVVGLNKKITTWRRLSKRQHVVKTTTEGCQNDNSELSKRQTQKTTPKDNSKRNTIAQNFSTFWKQYPRKKSRGQAEKTFQKLNPDEQLFADILSGLERAKKSWVDPKFIPYPSTWLNAKGWDDEEDKPSPKKANGKLARAQQAMEDFYAEKDDSGTALQDAGAAVRLFPSGGGTAKSG